MYFCRGYFVVLFLFRTVLQKICRRDSIKLTMHSSLYSLCRNYLQLFINLASGLRQKVDEMASGTHKMDENTVEVSFSGTEMFMDCRLPWYGVSCEFIFGFLNATVHNRAVWYIHKELSSCNINSFRGNSED